MREPYYVSRQSYWYDEGAYGVEVATKLDYASPGMLAPVDHSRYEGEYDDPREAAEAAIQLSIAWAEINGEREPYPLLIACNGIIYPVVEDAYSPGELRAWAQQRWDEIPKCYKCGAPALEYTSAYTGDTVLACTDQHADDLIADQLELS